MHRGVPREARARGTSRLQNLQIRLVQSEGERRPAPLGCPEGHGWGRIREEGERFLYFVVSAGGTAGHINPALAVADELRGRGHEILFVGTPDHIESTLAAQAGFPFTGFSVSGFDKAHPLSLLTSGKKILSATKKAKRLFSDKRPDAVLTFGAYVSIPVGRAAHEMDIPLIVHEQNSVMGMANAYLARFADVLALTYEGSDAGVKAKSAPVVLGNPVRASVEQSDRARGRAFAGVPDDALMLLVFGGSLGAQHLNRAICAMKERLLGIEDLYIVHSTGQADYDSVVSELALAPEQQRRWRVFPYIDCMGDVLAASDLVVSRAGASSLAEIATLHVPAVLVPYPYARGDHQTLNARSHVATGAAALVADADLDGEAFRDLVAGLLCDGERRATMAAACKKLSGADARRRLADLAISATKER